MAWLKYIYLVFLVIFTINTVEAASSKVYVWRNADGILVFSDSPKPGAEEVEVNDANTIKSSIDTSILDITPKKIEEKYEVEITLPKNNDTIRDNTGSAYVTGIIKPIFKRGLKIQLFLDGKLYGKAQDHSRFALRNVDRGEHQLKMEVVDRSGKVIASSSTVTFYMHRASVNRAR